MAEEEQALQFSITEGIRTQDDMQPPVPKTEDAKHLVDEEERLFMDLTRMQYKARQADTIEPPVRTPEKTFDALLLTTDDVAQNVTDLNKIPEVAAAAFFANENLVATDDAEQKKQLVIKNKNLNKNVELESKLRFAIDAAIGAETPEDHQRAMAAVIDASQTFTDFTTKQKGTSTSLLDVMSDMTEPEVQAYGGRRTLALSGFKDLMDKAGVTDIEINEDNILSFIRTAKILEDIIYPSEFPSGTTPQNPMAAFTGDPFVPIEQSSGFAGLVAFANSPVGQFMQEHPYITSAIFDATMVAATMVATPAGGATVAGARLLIGRALAMKAGSKAAPAVLAKAFGMKRKVLAAALMKARMPATVQVGLGLGAVYAAGRMLEDGSSKTAAFLTEVLGPAGAIVLFNLSKTSSIAYLRHMAVNNKTLFGKLNKELAKQKGVLAQEFLSDMEQAVKTQDLILGKTKQAAATATLSAEKPPLVRMLSEVDNLDPQTVNKTVDLVTAALSGNTPLNAAAKEVVGLDGLESLAAFPRLRSIARIELNPGDDIADIAQVVGNSSEIASTFRIMGDDLDNLVDDLIILKKKTVAKRPGGNATLETKAAAKAERDAIQAEINQAQLVRKSYTQAAKDVDLAEFGRNNHMFLQTPLARTLYNSLPQYEGLSGQILYRQMAKEVAGESVEIQNKTYNFINTTIRAKEGELLKQHTFGINPGVWSNKPPKLLGKLMESMVLTPRGHLRGAASELVDIPSRATEAKRVLAKGFNDAFEVVQRSLTRKERKHLLNLIAEGNQTEQVFKPIKGGLQAADGTVVAASPKTIDAYLATRNLLDAGWRIANQGVVRGMKAKGMRLLDGITVIQHKKVTVGFVDSSGTKMTKEMLEAEHQVFRIFDDEGKALQEIIFTPKQIKAKITDIPANQNVTGYHSGYAPIIHTGTWRVAKVLRMEDGTFRVSTQALGDTPKQAERAMVKLIGQETAGSKAFFFAARNNTTPEEVVKRIGKGRISVRGGEAPEAKETITSFIKTLDADSTLQKLTDDELDVLSKAMSEAGFGQEISSDLISEARFFSGGRHTRKRAKQRPASAADLSKPAETLGVEESLQRYWMAIADSASLSDVKIGLQGKFLNTYGRFLENGNDWTSKVMVKDAIRSGNADEVAKSIEAWNVQHRVKIISGMKTAEQKRLDNFWAFFRDDAIKKNRFRLAEKFDNLANAAEIQGHIRSATSKAVFGLWNFSHFLVQSVGTLNTLGRAVVHNPADLQKAMKSSLKYIYGRFAKKRGLKMDEEMKFLVDFVDDSGYITNVNYAALDEFINPSSTTLGRMVDASTVFTRKGEAVNRMAALTWNFHRNARLAKAGKHPLGFTADDLSSVKFRDYIKNEADLTAFNMSRLNQPMYAEGTAGLSFQFMQIFSQMGELFFGVGAQATKITRLERLGIWATSAAVLGPKAIPFAETTLAWFDNFVAEDIRLGNAVIKEGDPKDAGKIVLQAQREFADFAVTQAKKFGYKGDELFWRRASEAGLSKALSGGMIDFVDRATLQVATNTYYDNLEAEDAFGPGLNLVGGMILGSIRSGADLARAATSDEGLQNSDIMRAARNTIGRLGGARNILSTIEAVREGKITTRTGDAIIEGMSLVEIMAAAPDQKTEKLKDVFGAIIGIPSERQRVVQTENIVIRRQKEAWDEWIDITATAIWRSANEGNVKYALALVQEAMDQVNEAGLNVPYYQKKVIQALNKRPTDTMEERNVLRNLNYNLDGEINHPLIFKDRVRKDADE